MFANTRDVYQDVSSATFEAICSISVTVCDISGQNYMRVSLHRSLRLALFGQPCLGGILEWTLLKSPQTSGGSKRAARDACPPPRSPNSLNVMYFLRTFGTPPGELAPQPWGNHESATANIRNLTFSLLCSLWYTK